MNLLNIVTPSTTSVNVSCFARPARYVYGEGYEVPTVNCKGGEQDRILVVYINGGESTRPELTTKINDKNTMSPVGLLIITVCGPYKGKIVVSCSTRSWRVVKRNELIAICKIIFDANYSYVQKITALFLH